MVRKEITQVMRLPQRSVEAHKGSFGKVLIIAGSRAMPGAAGLCANAALRSGSGLVRLAVGQSIQQTVVTLAPCATTIGLAEDGDGQLGAEAFGTLSEALQEHDAAALGPGLGQSQGVMQLVKSVLGVLAIPLVIDADGLNALAGLRGEGLPLPQRTVLTPHPGEMKRLWSAWLREPLPKSRREQAEGLAEHCGGVVILKGHQTVVTNGRETYINTTGNAGMATAGSGDVLTGCLVSLLGQGAAVFDAAVLGVYIHGLAGDIARDRHGAISMIATDIIEALGEAWQRHQGGK